MEEDRLPLTRSLETEVRTGFAVPPISEGLSEAALVDALSRITVSEGESLVQALADQGYDAITSDSTAVLNWIDAVFAVWQSDYPLDGEFEQTVQAARPLAAAFACQEERFFTPGAHALHRLLDSLHEGFAGWSADLGKAARPALDAVNQVMQRCLQDFPSEPAVDHTLQLLEQKIQGHAGQLQRLDAGLIEREATAMASTLAGQTVAQYLGEQLGDATFPTKLSQFMGADWFEAGVNLVKNVGIQSDGWQQFDAATHQLIASFAEGATQGSRLPKPPADSSPESAAALPSAIRDILKQVGMSGDRAQSAAATLEYLLLRQASNSSHGAREAVTLDGRPAEEWASNASTSLAEQGIETGQWFQIMQPEGMRRLRLAGTVGGGRYFVFMDFTGARALRLGIEDFANLLRSKEAAQLDTRQTFSRAMVQAAEMQTVRVAEQENKQAEAQKLKAQAESLEAAERAQARDAASQQLREAEERVLGQGPATQIAAQSDEADRAVSAEQPFDRKTVLQLQIPIGTWLGFHDREPPIMARVAVRDLEKDSYIFTNRDGIKLRELTVPQLVTLIERDMVDILEHKTSFRETLSASNGQNSLGQPQQLPA